LGGSWLYASLPRFTFHLHAFLLVEIDYCDFSDHTFCCSWVSFLKLFCFVRCSSLCPIKSFYHPPMADRIDPFPDLRCLCAPPILVIDVPNKLYIWVALLVTLIWFHFLLVGNMIDFVFQALDRRLLQFLCIRRLHSPPIRRHSLGLCTRRLTAQATQDSTTT
jgi:hypothetical protein